MNREELLKAAKPILFNTDMVRAILEGKKTETRRVIKFPVNKYTKRRPIANNLEIDKKHSIPFLKKIYFNEKPLYCIEVKKPYTEVDILYVRETWQHLYELDGNEQIIEGTGRYYYAATDQLPGGGCIDSRGISHEKTPWKPSIHMPKDAARIFLKVTDIRPERLQDIDDNGVVAEGLQIGDPFDDLWNSTIKKADQDRYGWDANPWVWVIEFERCEKPEEWCV